MTLVAGVDGMPGGWAVVLAEVGEEPRRVMRVRSLSELFYRVPEVAAVAIDIPIGLLDTYQEGGRSCDRVARRRLAQRGSSVFPAPIRPVLGATDYAQACARSCGSGPGAKKLSKQAFAIVPKVAEVDAFLATAEPDMRKRVVEVHPELCFAQIAGAPMKFAKSEVDGAAERLSALQIVGCGDQGLRAEARGLGIRSPDYLDAAAACWTALRVAQGAAESIVDPIPRDSIGLPMTMWV